MKILIFGGSGFIGKNLTSLLPHDFILDCVSLRNENWKEDVVRSDVFVNLIGKAHDHQGTASEQDYYKANVELVVELFQAFQTSSANLFIHISSLAALEELESQHPLTELDSCHPVSFYGKSKRAAEKWLLKQDLPVGKKLIILRPPMIHGPGDKGNLNLLYKLISKGIPYPLSLFKNKRSFLSIQNFCFFVEQIIKHQDSMSSGIYHIADDEALATTDLIRIIKSVTAKRVPDIAVPRSVVRFLAKIGDFIPFPLNSRRLKKMTSNLLLSNAKIKNSLGLKNLPLTAEEGIERTIRFLGSKA